MKIRHLVAVLGIAAVAALGFAATPAGASTTGAETFTLLSTDPSDNAQPIVIANGPVHARGTDVQVSGSIDRFVFPAGTLRVQHKTTGGTSHDTFDPVTCYGTHTERGTFTVVRGSGAYKAASGSGSYRLAIAFVGCDPQAQPDLFSLTIHAHGTLTI
jgi:hypothetical protein